MDSDEDGFGDNGDAFPEDPAASVDTDGDGYPDWWNVGMSAEDSSTGLRKVHQPKDEKAWKKDEGPGFGTALAMLAMTFSVLVGLSVGKHN